jgi:hypothetical protein
MTRSIAAIPLLVLRWKRAGRLAPTAPTTLTLAFASAKLSMHPHAGMGMGAAIGTRNVEDP